VLVDTTFLLPALGVEVEEEAMKVTPFFRRFEVHYLEVELMEAMWNVLKLIPLEKLDRVRLGLEAVRETYRLLTPPARAYRDAIEVYRRGHRDYIDALHYATARIEKIPFLTIDYNLTDFLREHGYELEGVVLTPKTVGKPIGEVGRFFALSMLYSGITFNCFSWYLFVLVWPTSTKSLEFEKVLFIG